MSGQRTIIYGCRNFPDAEFGGGIAAEAAGRIRDAIRRGKGLDICERRVPVVGALHRGESGWGIREMPNAMDLTLGAGMVYFRTTTAAFVWNMLIRMLHGRESRFVLKGEPAYVSDTASFQFGAKTPIVFGRSSLLDALGLPSPEWGHHARMRDMLEGLGAFVRIREIVLAMPVPAAKGVLAVDGDPGMYAMGIEIPLGDITMVDSLRFMEKNLDEAEGEGMQGGEKNGGRQTMLDELCTAEARVEIFRTEGATVQGLKDRMLDGVRRLGLSAEGPGRRWE